MKHITLTHFILSAAIIFSCTFFANAQSDKKTDKKTDDSKTAPVVVKGAASYIDVFFKKYKTSADSAIDYLFSTNKLFTNETQISLLKLKLDSMQISLGKYTGKELIAQKSASPSLVVYSYLVKHENQPIRFVFMFYKPKNEWEIYRFNYDDSMDAELLEAVKINNKH